MTKGLTAAEVDGVEQRLEEIRAVLARARSERADAEQIMDEVTFSIDLVSLLVHDLQARLEVDGHIVSVPEAQRDLLERELNGLMERYRSLWLERNRPGGLEDSLAWLSNVKSAYATGQPDPSWGGISLH